MRKLIEILFEIFTTLGLRALVVQVGLVLYKADLTNSTLLWMITVTFGVVFAECFTIRRKHSRRRLKVVEDEAEDSSSEESSE